MKDRIKICKGNLDDIDDAVKDGIININDIIITRDTHQFVQILPDGSKQIIGNDEFIVVNELPSQPNPDIVYLLKPDKLYIYDSGWVWLNEPQEKIEALSNSDLEEILRNL